MHGRKSHEPYEQKICSSWGQRCLVKHQKSWLNCVSGHIVLVHKLSIYCNYIWYKFNPNCALWGFFSVLYHTYRGALRTAPVCLVFHLQCARTVVIVSCNHSIAQFCCIGLPERSDSGGNGNVDGNGEGDGNGDGNGGRIGNGNGNGNGNNDSNSNSDGNGNNVLSF